MLNVRPAEGRGFVETDCAAAGQVAVVMLSDELWQSAFGADASLVGKRVILNRTAFTVVGIAPAGFGGTEPVPSAFWVPITMQPAMEPDRDFLGRRERQLAVAAGARAAGRFDGAGAGGP